MCKKAHMLHEVAALTSQQGSHHGALPVLSAAVFVVTFVSPVQLAKLSELARGLLD